MSKIRNPHWKTYQVYKLFRSPLTGMVEMQVEKEVKISEADAVVLNRQIPVSSMTNGTLPFCNFYGLDGVDYEFKGGQIVEIAEKRTRKPKQEIITE